MSRLRRTPALLTACFALSVSTSPAHAQAKPVDTLLTVDKYLDYEQVAEPRISPDGSQIVYTRRWVNRIEDRWESALWMVSADGSRNRFLAKGSNAVWSPDGTRIAYLADGEPTGKQIFVRFMDAEGATSQLTHTMEAPADLRWSPDGKRIAFSMVVPKSVPWKIDMPAPPKDAKWVEAPRIVETRHFRQDRRGLVDPGFRHLFVIPADGGAARQITRGDWSIGARFDGLDDAVGFDWTPDGRTMVADGVADSTGDANYRNSNLYAIDVATGALRRLNTENGDWSSPVVSPDGRRIAYRGYTELTSSYHASELYVMNIDGTSARRLSGEHDRDAEDVQWAADGSGVYFSLADHGTSNAFFAAMNGSVRAVTHGEHMLTGLTVARNGRAAAVRTSYQAPSNIARFGTAPNSGDVTQLTHMNEELLSRLKLGEVERIRYASTGGTSVDGWIVKPPGFDRSRRYPLIMEIHGGPHAMYNVGFSYMYQNFAAHGFVVLYVNPRGSTGYGSQFGNAIMRAYPSVDYDDLMAGVDTVVGRGYVDTTRMYVGGCSGGGVLSSWVIGHTNRFAAAAVRCPVINWMSFAGQTDVPLFSENWFDAPFWEKPEQWLKQSPLMYVGRVTTPTVVMTGVLDLRTPMPQSEEYYEALKARGIPAALLRFEGEYHGTGSRPSNFMRTQLYMMSWYNRWRREGSVVTTASASTP